MNNRLTIATALLAGLVGGMITRYIGPPIAFAQAPAPSVKEIRAQSFTLVDDMNQTVGTFKVVGVRGGSIIENGIPKSIRFDERIVLRDSAGQEIWSAGGSKFRSLAVK